MDIVFDLERGVDRAGIVGAARLRDVALRRLPDRVPERGPDRADGLEALDRIGTLLRLERNQMVFSESDAAEHVYRLVSGTVRLCKITPDGRRQITGFVQAGGFFGFEWAAAFGVTAEAVSDVTVYSYARRQLDRMQRELPPLRDHFQKMMAEQFSAAQSHVLLLGRHTAREKVGAFLLALAARAGRSTGDMLELPMGRQDIADYLGLTIETVCRVLHDLKKQRMISVPDIHHIGLISVEAMVQLVSGVVFLPEARGRATSRAA